MSKKGKVLSDVAEALALVVLALLALEVTPLVMLFFVPLVAYYIWRFQDKVKELEQRLSTLEKPPKEPSTPGTES